MKYEKFIDKEIKKVFENKKIDFSNFELDENTPKVDVKEFIANYTNLEIKEVPMNRKSGEFNAVNKEIIINSLENDKRQRFSMAHELGHALLDHGSANRHHDRKLYGYDLDKLHNEMVANRFAAKFLMPEKLLYYAKDFVLKGLDLASSELTESLKGVISARMAELLEVSLISMEYRLENINFNWEKNYE
ncbi:ImmA/IrrE family metallo-endopeptidase [Gemella cuniculi]|uniref:ImmA/IrrE family metallo-endopeptidase n=1 Tax=Gemella cuniculi TaxID=150240 RepID=UPI0004160D25|nr:ImmA/IrrE family metallo-endopeptidase [Gemella cuniculi]